VEDKAIFLQVIQIINYGKQ